MWILYVFFDEAESFWLDPSSGMRLDKDIWNKFLLPLLTYWGKYRLRVSEGKDYVAFNSGYLFCQPLGIPRQVSFWLFGSNCDIYEKPNLESFCKMSLIDLSTI
jgi:hypothetical protein